MYISGLAAAAPSLDMRQFYRVPALAAAPGSPVDGKSSVGDPPFAYNGMRGLGDGFDISQLTPDALAQKFRDMTGQSKPPPAAAPPAQDEGLPWGKILLGATAIAIVGAAAYNR